MNLNLCIRQSKISFWMSLDTWLSKNIALWGFVRYFGYGDARQPGEPGAGLLMDQWEKETFAITKYQALAVVSFERALMRLIQTFSIWHLTFDTWHLTFDIWHLTFNIWHLTFDICLFWESLDEINTESLVALKERHPVLCLLGHLNSQSY